MAARPALLLSSSASPRWVTLFIPFALSSPEDDCRSAHFPSGLSHAVQMNSQSCLLTALPLLPSAPHSQSGISNLLEPALPSRLSWCFFATICSAPWSSLPCLLLRYPSRAQLRTLSPRCSSSPLSASGGPFGMPSFAEQSDSYHTRQLCATLVSSGYRCKAPAKRLAALAVVSLT